jgi:hypothetical protein
VTRVLRFYFARCAADFPAAWFRGEAPDDNYVG